MEPGEINIEEVIKKWEKHHPLPAKKEVDEKPWYQQPLSEYANVKRRKVRKSICRKSTPDYVNESHHWQKKFRVIPPIVKTGIQNYQISQCNKCQDVLQYFPLVSKDCLKSQTLNLFDYIAAKKSVMKWHGARYFQSMILAACYQSKDGILLKQISQKPNPVLFLHNVQDFFSSFLLYLFCASLGKVPYTIIMDKDVSSPILKYLLKKIRFIFVGEGTDDNSIQSTTEALTKLLKSNNHVLIGLGGNDETVSPTSSIFLTLVDELRKDDKLLQQLLLLPVTLSIEKDFNLFSKLSFFGILCKWFYFPKLYRGLAQFNISRSVKLQSMMTLAEGLNKQESCDEENYLIQRHISYDLLDTGAILPTHLVSFLLITKYRDSVCINELIDSVKWLLNELREMDKFLGFSGETNDIIYHALDLLQHDDLLKINTETKIIIPEMKSCNSAQKLFQNAKQIIHMFMTKAIVGSSIVACMGGQQELQQGSGYNMKCSGDKILEKAEYLAELLSFLLDYCCPFNKISDALVDSLEKLVTMDVLNTYTDTYESQSHQKLVHSVAVNSGWEEEEEGNDATECGSDIRYDVSVQDDVVLLLNFLYSCIAPFIEISFTVVAFIREWGEGTKFSTMMINESLTKRFKDGFFPYGEMITSNFISRVLDYLYEKEVIDENDGCFMLSASFTPGNGELERLLADIALFR